MPKGYDMEHRCRFCGGSDMLHVMGQHGPIGCATCFSVNEGYRPRVRYEDRQKAKELGMVWKDGEWVLHKPQPKVEVQAKKDFRKDMRLVYFVDDAAIARALIAPDLKRLERARKRAERNHRKPATDLIDWLARPLNDMVKGIEAFGIGTMAVVLAFLIMMGSLLSAINHDGRKLTAQRQAAVEACKRSNALHRSQAQNWEDTARMMRNQGQGDKAELMEWSAVEQREEIIDCANLTNR